MKKMCKLLSKDNIRELCIDNNYYTRGSNEDYANLMSMVDYESKKSKSNANLDRLELLARDIKEHSDTDDSVDRIMARLGFYVRIFILDDDGKLIR